MLFSSLLILIFGLFVGSFLNVLADRLPKGESPFGGRSHCDHCKKKIAWYDLVPVLSFIFLGGKCRYCRTRLSWYYPTTELITGIIFVLTAFFILNGSQFLISNFKFLINFQLPITNYQLLITLIYYLFIVSSLIVIFFSDLKYGIIPDKIVFPAILISFLYLILHTPYLILPHLVSGMGASAFFFLLFVVTRGKGMGFGDVKFSFLMGLMLGFPKIIIALYIAFLTGAVIGIILIVWKKKKLAGTKIPFGPFLVFGTIAALFFGDRIMQLVMRFLFPM